MCRAWKYTRSRSSFHLEKGRLVMPDLFITEAPEELKEDQEPQPGEKKTKRGRPQGSRSRNSPAGFKKEFTDELTALLRMAAMLWSTQDPTCGGVLNETAENIARDIAELAATSAKARKYLQKTMGVGKIVPLLVDLTPLVMTIRSHHPRMFGRAGTDESDVGTGAVADFRA